MRYENQKINISAKVIPLVRPDRLWAPPSILFNWQRELWPRG